MNEILFMIGTLPVHTGEALIGFGVLALILLLAIAIVVARSGRRGPELAMAQAIRADELEERLAKCCAPKAKPPAALTRWDRLWRGGRPKWPARSPNGSIR